MSGTTQAAARPGFADPARDSQNVFRAVMNALARPTRTERLDVALQPPRPLTPELAAVALTLADGAAPLWLDAPLAARPEVAAYLKFHTGAPIVSDPLQASFALVSDPSELPPFDAFAIGTEEFPDRSTTLVLAVEVFEAGEPLTFEGPGMVAPASFAPSPVPADLARRLQANRALFPRGLDLVFTCPGLVAALPRSARLVAGKSGGN